MIPELPPTLEIHFEGEQMSPDQVPYRALADALAAIQKLAAGSIDFDTEDASPLRNADDSLRLVGIRRGSAVYQVFGPPPIPARTNLRVVGLVVDHPEEIGPENDYTLKPIERLSTIGRRLGCSIAIREPGTSEKPGAILARIGPDTYGILAQSFLIRGETTIHGRVERVGGATAARCGLRVPFQDRLLICKVTNSEVARRIGGWLYQDVAVSGMVEWLKHSFRIFSFTINAVSRPNQGTITDALEALRNAGGDAWDLIADPDAYLDEVRRES